MITKIRRRAIWAAHHHICAYCQTHTVENDRQEIDHIIPVQGLKAEERQLLYRELGLPEDYDLDSLDNLLPADRKCNQLKGSNKRDIRFYLHFRGLAQDRRQQVEKIEIDLKKKGKKGDQFAIVAEMIDGREDEIEKLANLSSGESGEFKEGRHRNGNHLAISRLRIKLECFLPTREGFEGSALLTLKALKLRSLMITFSHRELCACLWKGLGLPIRSKGRGFLFGHDTTSNKIGVSLGNATFFLEQEDYVQLCEVVDEAGQVYLDEAYQVENEWGTLSSDYRGKSTFSLGKMSPYAWNEALGFANKHDSAAGKTSWHRFDRASGALKICEWNDSRTKWNYKAILYANQSGGIFSYLDDLQIMWKPSTYAPNTFWNAGETKSFLMDCFIPHLAEQLRVAPGLFSFLFRRRHSMSPSPSDLFSSIGGYWLSTDERPPETAEAMAYAFGLLQAYFNGQTGKFYKKALGNLALEALELIIVQADIPPRGLAYIAEKLQSTPNKDSLIAVIKTNRHDLINQDDVTADSLDYWLRGVYTVLDHRQLTPTYFPQLSLMYKSMIDLIKYEVYRERLAVEY